MAEDQHAPRKLRMRVNTHSFEDCEESEDYNEVSESEESDYSSRGLKKKHGKPRKILQAQHIAAERQDIYNRNATESALLNLPPEVRTRIWCCVLGGHTIHVDNREPRHGFAGHSLAVHDGQSAGGQHAATKVRNRMCQTREDSTASGNEVSEAAETIVKEDYHTKHSKCWNTPKNRLGLRLLRVCRQVHQEAALLPYQENNFVMERGFLTLSRFLMALMPVQSQALHSLEIVVEYPTYGEPDDQLKSAYIRARLPKLRSLVVLVQLRKGTVFFPKTVREQIAAKILLFRHLPLSSMTVATQYLEKYALMSLEVAKAWSTGLEEKLLQRYDKAAVVGLKARKKQEREKQAQVDEERRLQNRVGGGRLREVKK
ncbi:hypothetical protein LTR56_000986 [Elasticomyces elasticus]|nr:hypothetical protein LTR22_013202 [Elasticomyces elasticus]KAK3660060.1 hypothetical protein LTR56_000986 [Elasticomyces elasticus]KAK4911061.1 hypothetical protein LTR49_020324 [Elasticomyces elasticus]KAK5750533.1 hypothetical protein LTS12_019409 [Elasticomyces elasticus]